MLAAEVQVVRHLVVVVVVHGDVGLCRLQDENCDGARRRLLCWYYSVVVVVCVFPIWTYGAVACYQLQLVLPSFWHLSWPVGSTPITYRERHHRQLSQKRQHCIHYIASCSLDDGLHRKKTPAWLSVHQSGRSEDCWVTTTASRCRRRE